DGEAEVAEQAPLPQLLPECAEFSLYGSTPLRFECAHQRVDRPQAPPRSPLPASPRAPPVQRTDRASSACPPAALVPEHQPGRLLHMLVELTHVSLRHAPCTSTSHSSRRVACWVPRSPPARRCAPPLIVRHHDRCRRRSEIPCVIRGLHENDVLPPILVALLPTRLQLDRKGVAAVGVQDDVTTRLHDSVLITNCVRRAARIDPRARIRDRTGHDDRHHLAIRRP